MKKIKTCMDIICKKYNKRCDIDHLFKPSTELHTIGDKFIFVINWDVSGISSLASDEHIVKISKKMEKDFKEFFGEDKVYTIIIPFRK